MHQTVKHLVCWIKKPFLSFTKFLQLSPLYALPQRASPWISIFWFLKERLIFMTTVYVPPFVIPQLNQIPDRAHGRPSPTRITFRGTHSPPAVHLRALTFIMWNFVHGAAMVHADGCRHVLPTLQEKIIHASTLSKHSE